MNLYEINEAITSCIDMETGEIIDMEKLNQLEMERDSKIEGVALWIKNLKAEADAIKAEREKLAERERAAENKVEGLKRYLSDALCGQKFETPRVKCSFRKSNAVVVDDEFMDWAKNNHDEFLRYKEPEINKTAIKQAIEAGTEVMHAQIENRTSLVIK